VFRRLAVVAAVPLLLLGLASCRSDPNVAAYVGDKQITIDQIDDYYSKAAKDALTSQVVSQQPAQIKPMLVSMLVYLSLLKDAAGANHVNVSAGEVAQAKEAVEPQRSQLTDARVLLPVDDLAELQAYQVELSDWARTGTADENAATTKYNTALRSSLKDNPVKVNPRFGKFDLENVPTMLNADVAVSPAPSASAAP
jgi:hypothetical protein